MTSSRVHLFIILKGTEARRNAISEVVPFPDSLQLWHDSEFSVGFEI